MGTGMAINFTIWNSIALLVYNYVHPYLVVIPVLISGGAIKGYMNFKTYGDKQHIIKIELL